MYTSRVESEGGDYIADSSYKGEKAKTAVFSMRIEAQKKSSLDLLYNSLGLSLAEAVNLFFEKSLTVGGIPFDLRMENYDREILEALQETLDIETGKIQAKRYHSVEELFAENET